MRNDKDQFDHKWKQSDFKNPSGWQPKQGTNKQPKKKKRKKKK